MVIGFFFHDKYAFCTDLIFCSVPTETKPTNRILSWRRFVTAVFDRHTLFFGFFGPSTGAYVNHQGDFGLWLRVVLLLPINSVKSLTIQSLGHFTGRCNVRLVDASTVRDLPRTGTVFVRWYIRRSHLWPKRKLYP